MPRAGFWRARTALKRGTMFEEFVFPLVIAVIALIVAIRANKQTSRLRARIEVLEAQRQTTAAPVAVPPPLPSYEPLRASPEPSRAESAPEEAAPPIAPEPMPEPGVTKLRFVMPADASGETVSVRVRAGSAESLNVSLSLKQTASPGPPA